jgi:hypothetical protein
MAGLLVVVTVISVHRRVFSGAYEMAAIAAIASSVIYQLGVRPAVTIGETAVTLRQPYCQRVAALTLIDGVTRSRGLTIHLADGTQWKAWAFSSSMIASWLGDSKARQVAVLIEEARQRPLIAATTRSTYRTTIDVLPTAIILVVAFGLTSAIALAGSLR